MKATILGAICLCLTLLHCDAFVSPTMRRAAVIRTHRSGPALSNRPLTMVNAADTMALFKGSVGPVTKGVVASLGPLYEDEMISSNTGRIVSTVIEFLNPYTDDPKALIVKAIGLTVIVLLAALSGNTIGRIVQTTTGYRLPWYQRPRPIYACNRCNFELHPTSVYAMIDRLRSSKFSCPKCFGPASEYFNVANLRDPRARARLERLKKEQEEKEEEEKSQIKPIKPPVKPK